MRFVDGAVSLDSLRWKLPAAVGQRVQVDPDEITVDGVLPSGLQVTMRHHMDQSWHFRAVLTNLTEVDVDAAVRVQLDCLAGPIWAWLAGAQGWLLAPTNDGRWWVGEVKHGSVGRTADGSLVLGGGRCAPGKRIIVTMRWTPMATVLEAAATLPGWLPSRLVVAPGGDLALPILDEAISVDGQVETWIEDDTTHLRPAIGVHQVRLDGPRGQTTFTIAASGGLAETVWDRAQAVIDRGGLRTPAEGLIVSSAAVSERVAGADHGLVGGDGIFTDELTDNRPAHPLLLAALASEATRLGDRSLLARVHTQAALLDATPGALLALAHGVVAVLAGGGDPSAMLRRIDELADGVDPLEAAVVRGGPAAILAESALARCGWGLPGVPLAGLDDTAMARDCVLLSMVDTTLAHWPHSPGWVGECRTSELLAGQISDDALAWLLLGPQPS